MRCPMCGDPLSCSDGICVCNGCGFTCIDGGEEVRECVAPPLEGEGWEIPWEHPPPLKRDGRYEHI